MNDRWKLPVGGSRLRAGLVVVLAVAALAAVAAGGWAVVSARASGSGVSIPLAAASPQATPTTSATPSSGPTTAPPPVQWTAARALGPLTVYKQPGPGAPVKLRLPALSRYGVPTVLLVQHVRQIGSQVWYQAWLPVAPNGSRGWVPGDKVTVYAVTSEIVIDRHARTLQVLRGGKVVAQFKCAVGRPSLPTPAGFFYITEKLRPANPGGPYGVLAMATSAFAPKLSYWLGGGQVAIHGTNEPQLIGQPVSHGCVRMTNASITAVSNLVSVGSTVVIQ